MFRGIITFKCSECGCTFEAPDIELGAMVLSTPQPCPQCKSRRTAPQELFGRINPIYRKIWKEMEKWSAREQGEKGWT